MTVPAGEFSRVSPPQASVAHKKDWWHEHTTGQGRLLSLLHRPLPNRLAPCDSAHLALDT